MNYRDFKQRWDDSRGPVLTLVNQMDDRLQAVDARVDALALRDEFPEYPFSPRVWTVWQANTAKLRGIKRRDHFPYATHPSRMALICYWLIASPEAAESSAVLALVHDYLEEGDGLTLAGVTAMRQIFDERATLAAVVLSEPGIDYASLGGASELPFWRRAAYVLQAEEAIKALEGGQAYANAALADKIDNLHDLSYIALDPKLTPETRRVKLAHRLGYFTFAESHLGTFAEPGFREILLSGIAAKAAAFGLDQASIIAAADDLAERARSQGSAMMRMTRAYQASLAIKL